jgi:hypothetical protein
VAVEGHAEVDEASQVERCDSMQEPLLVAFDASVTDSAVVVGDPSAQREHRQPPNALVSRFFEHPPAFLSANRPPPSVSRQKTPGPGQAN